MKVLLNEITIVEKCSKNKINKHETFKKYIKGPQAAGKGAAATPDKDRLSLLRVVFLPPNLSHDTCIPTYICIQKTNKVNGINYFKKYV